MLRRGSFSHHEFIDALYDRLSDFEGDFCENARIRAVTAGKVTGVEKKDNTLAIAIPIVVILALIVIVGAVVLFTLYRKR